MKKIIYLVFLIFSISSLSAQKGIVFETSFTSWNEVLEKARFLNKPVFVDVFTTWCGPCKLMDRTVFNMAEVGKYYNDNFLCVKIDAEKGYGIEFNKKNNIAGYPSYVFFSPIGDLIQVNVGAQETTSFLSLGSNVMKDYKLGENLQAMEDKMQSGDYDSAFLVTYIKKLGKVQKINEKAMEKYLSFMSSTSLYSDDTYEFIRSNYNGWLSYHSKAFEVLDSAYKKYPVKSMELMKPWYVLNGRLLSNVELAIEQKDSAGIEEVIKAYYKMYPDAESYRMNSQFVYCQYFAGIRDSINFQKYMNLFIKDNITNVENSKQQKIELERYQAALNLKYGIYNGKELSPDDLWFAKSYICKYRQTLDQLKGIQSYYTKYMDKNSDYEKIMTKALNIALENYKSFSPNVNKFIFQFYLK